MSRLKICWAGWTGPDMAEIASGILPFDPDPQLYILGSGMVRDEQAYYLGHSRKVAYYTDADRFFSDIANGGYDVLIHNSYAYSVGHRPEIHPLADSAAVITEDPRWKSIAAFKVLHEGESFTQFEYYKGIIDRFDGVVTYNRKLKDLCDSLKVPSHQTCICCPAGLRDQGLERDVDVSYTGSNLGVGYRGMIKGVLQSLPDKYNIAIHEGAFSGLTVDKYLELICRSKIQQCTHSNPNGELFPMALKNREGKALLCGAMPICEIYSEADVYLEPGKEKVVFRSTDELIDMLLHYLENEDDRKAIVEAGQKKIREKFTCDILFRDAFSIFGLL